MQRHLPKIGKAAPVAVKTLGVLAQDQRVSNGTIRSTPNEAYAQNLLEASIDPDTKVMKQLVQKMLRAKIHAAVIAEVYVPCVARRLGDHWDADILDFRAVSIGLARLQALLWQLGPEWDQTGALPVGAVATLLVAVPKGCHHTLGATVLAGQLRYRGISTQLELEADEARFVELASTKQYVGILLSASAREPLEGIADLLQSARRAYPATPILVGGNVMEQSVNIKLRTGADMVTSDLETALEFCGLGSLSTTAASTRQVGRS